MAYMAFRNQIASPAAPLLIPHDLAKENYLLGSRATDPIFLLQTFLSLRCCFYLEYSPLIFLPGKHLLIFHFTPQGFQMTSFPTHFAKHWLFSTPCAHRAVLDNHEPEFMTSWVSSASAILSFHIQDHTLY